MIIPFQALRRNHVPQKPCNPLCSECTTKIKSEMVQYGFVDHSTKLKNERSTAEFRIHKLNRPSEKNESSKWML